MSLGIRYAHHIPKIPNSDTISSRELNAPALVSGYPNRPLIAQPTRIGGIPYPVDWRVPALHVGVRLWVTRGGNWMWGMIRAHYRVATGGAGAPLGKKGLLIAIEFANDAPPRL